MVESYGRDWHDTFLVPSESKTGESDKIRRHSTTGDRMMYGYINQRERRWN